MFDRFVTVSIDDRIPIQQFEMADYSGDWWAPLCEKAYAKLNGSYHAIDGGYPRISMHHLTGGISVDIYTKETKKRNF